MQAVHQTAAEDGWRQVRAMLPKATEMQTRSNKWTGMDKLHQVTTNGWDNSEGKKTKSPRHAQGGARDHAT